jgi:hypothetical protein
MLKMLIKLLGRKTEENPNQKPNEDANRTFGSIEEILNVVENPVKKIIAENKIGEDVSKEVENFVRAPTEYGAKIFIDNNRYIEMLNELETAGITIPQESVDFWLQRQYSHDLTFGFPLPKDMNRFASREAIHKKGMEVYRFLVEQHEKSQSDHRDIYYFGNGRREKLAAGFGLSRKDTLELDRREFSNILAFSIGGDLYKLAYSTTETVEDVLKNSRVTEFREWLGLEKEQVVDIIEEYVRTTLNGKSAIRVSGYSGDRVRESIENAYGMLLEFGEQLSLTEAEEKKLAGMYKATKYGHINLVEKYFPDEVAEWRKSRVKADETAKFNNYWKSERVKIKNSEPFESERFIKYDRNCFMEALRHGDFGFAHKIASERDYQELPFLEKIAKE